MHADALLYEGFDYSAGALAGQNGGTGFTTAWSSSGAGGDVVTAPGKTYSSGGDLDVVGNFTTVSNSGTAGSFRNFSTITAATSTTYWISMIASTSGIVPGSGNDAASIEIRNASNVELLSVGAFGSSANWRIRARSSNRATSGFSDAGDTSNSGTDAFLLIRVDVDTSGAGADNIYFWTDPTLGAEPTIVSAESSITGTNFWDADEFSISRIRSGVINSGSTGDKTLNYDEFRLGTTFADVTPIPEPGVFALVLSSILGVIGIGRRRRNG